MTNHLDENSARGFFFLFSPDFFSAPTQVFPLRAEYRCDGKGQETPMALVKNQYLRTQVETASKEQLVVMLFDGIVRFTEQARKALADKDVESSHNLLMRAQAIIMELICTVDKERGGEVAKNLLALHAYAFNCLVVCNMKKDASKIDEVQRIYRELRDGWQAAMESLGLSASRVSVSAASPAPGQSAGDGSMALADGLAAREPELSAAPAASRYGMGKTSSLSVGREPSLALGKQSGKGAAIASPVSPRRAAVIGAYAVGARSVS